MKANIFFWNLQGVGNPKFHRVLKEYLRDFDFEVVVLVETRVSGPVADKVIRSVGIPNSHRVEARGFSGGIWVLWKCNIDVVVEINNFQFIHMKDKFSGLWDWVLFSGVYRSPHWVIRKELWEDLGVVVGNTKNPWLLAVNFNALLNEDKKQGGSKLGN